LRPPTVHDEAVHAGQVDVLPPEYLRDPFEVVDRLVAMVVFEFLDLDAEDELVVGEQRHTAVVRYLYAADPHFGTSAGIVMGWE
jgi:hypothetical protein